MRSEQVDAAAVLRDGVRADDANGTDPAVRADELRRVRDYWPENLLDGIAKEEVVAPPWRLLVDPTRWADVNQEAVLACVHEALGRGRWPALDDLRRRFGRISNHRAPSEVEGQGSLL